MMKLAIFLIWFYISQPIKPVIINTTWTYKVTNTCANFLKFRPHAQVYEYDCELSYTMKGTYQIKGDTLITTIVDDSHSEDTSKGEIYITKYLMIKNTLLAMQYKKYVQGKWQTIKLQRAQVSYKLTVK